MDVIEPKTDCPACWGNGFHQLVPEEEPLDCSRCGATGRVTLAEAAAIRQEARDFVAAALEKAGGRRVKRPW